MAADAKPSRGLRDSSAVRRDIALALKDVPVFEYGDEINDYTPVRCYFVEIIHEKTKFVQIVLHFSNQFVCAQNRFHSILTPC